MTTYHFKRSVERSGIQNSVFNIDFLKFLTITLIFFLLDIINIPNFFGGTYHLFVFESYIFFSYFIKKSKFALLTIFTFYAITDIIELNFIGTSFIAIL